LHDADLRFSGNTGLNYATHHIASSVNADANVLK
jgi:hypothetical protein